MVAVAAIRRDHCIAMESAASAESGCQIQHYARVLAVDDGEAFRALIRRVVDATPGFHAVGEAHSGECAVAAVEELQADLVVMDVYMPGMGGIAAADLIKASRPATVVVLLSSTHPEDLPGYAKTCLADAVLWKPELCPRLLEQIWLSTTT